MSDGRFDALARYNAERARGIVRTTEEWQAEMASWQQVFDEMQREEMIRLIEADARPWWKRWRPA